MCYSAMADFNSHTTVGLCLCFVSSKFFEKPVRQNYLYALLCLMIYVLRDVAVCHWASSSSGVSGL